MTRPTYEKIPHLRGRAENAKRHGLVRIDVEINLLLRLISAAEKHKPLWPTADYDGPGGFDGPTGAE